MVGAKEVLAVVGTLFGVLSKAPYKFTRECVNMRGFDPKPQFGQKGEGKQVSMSEKKGSKEGKGRVLEWFLFFFSLRVRTLVDEWGEGWVSKKH